jgi:hypothetical protein
MNVVTVYSRLYAGCLKRALGAIRKSPWTLLLPMAVWAAALVAQQFLSGLGFLSGVATALALSALSASYLYFLGELQSDARVSIRELGRSFGPYFWAVANLGFVVWVLDYLLGMALMRNPQAGVIFLIVYLAELVLLNAAPEIIYIRHTYGGLATVQHSIRFIHESWIEWFLPNIVLGAGFYYGLTALAGVGVPDPVVGVVAGAVFHVAMVFRGHLFAELDTSSHRQRMFKYRSRL